MWSSIEGTKYYNVQSLWKNSNSNPGNSDENKLKLILKELELNYTAKKMFWFGNHSTRDRPLKVIFPIGTNIFEILRGQNKLRWITDWKDIRISSGRTQKQREEMSTQRKQLEYRRNNGEIDIIRYQMC